MNLINNTHLFQDHKNILILDHKLILTFLNLLLNFLNSKNLNHHHHHLQYHNFLFIQLLQNKMTFLSLQNMNLKNLIKNLIFQSYLFIHMF